MQKQQLNSKGFGLVSVLSVIVVLALAGGAGAYVYYRDHKKKPETTITSTTSSKNSGQSTTQSSTGSQNSTATQQTYLTMKEWGIKLPLSDPIKDAYYVVSTSSKDSNGQPNTMWLGLTSLNNSGCNAA
jgi:hypothetical protein